MSSFLFSSRLQPWSKGELKVLPALSVEVWGSGASELTCRLDSSSFPFSFRYYVPPRLPSRGLPKFRGRRLSTCT